MCSGRLDWSGSKGCAALFPEIVIGVGSPLTDIDCLRIDRELKADAC